MSLRAGLLDRLERRPGRTLALVGGVFALAYVAAFTVVPSRHRPIDGDAIQYYAYLRSAVFDGDLDFANDYATLYGTPDKNRDTNVWLYDRTPIGRAPNQMSVGPAILWSPLYVVVYGVLRALHTAGVAVTLDGYSLWFQLASGLAGIFYATAGAYLCFRTAALLFDRRAAFWGTLVAWLASPAVYYSVISPAYSHAVSLFAVALFVFVWLRGLDRITIGRFAGLGLLAGLAALVRWQDVVVLVLPATELVRALVRRSTPAPIAVTAGAALAATTGLAVLPQLVAWHAIYGAYLAMPQGSTFMRWTEPAIVSVLVSTRRGLWLWTPAVLVASLGLVAVYRRDRRVGAALALVFALTVYVNASVSDWWAGEAFGARRFIADTVIFGMGLSAIGAWLEARAGRQWLRVTGVAIIAYNLLFLFQYQMFMRGYRDLVPYPTTVKQILIDRLILPFDVLRAWFLG